MDDRPAHSVETPIGNHRALPGLTSAGMGPCGTGPVGDIAIEMSMIVLRSFPALLVALLGAMPATAQETTLAGVWLHANQRIELEMAPCGDRLCGKLIWFKNPTDVDGRPLVDRHNPDPALRMRPLMGLTVVQGLRRVDARTWEDGKVYNPNDGRSYDLTISIENDRTARVRAYLGVPLLGQTQIWTRVDQGPLVSNDGTASER